MHFRRDCLRRHELYCRRASSSHRSSSAVGMSATALTTKSGEAGWWTALKSADMLRVVAAGVALGWVLVVVVGPLVAPYPPLALSATALASPSPVHWFGTDELGRDVLSRVIWGARVSIPYSVLILGVSAGFGAVIGGLAGYFGGWLDEVLMRATDLVFAFPTII